MCIALLGSAIAQHAVTGTVVSASDGAGLPGVTVAEKGTSNGTLTDVDGKFSLKVASEKSTIVFSFIGMKSVTEVVNSRKVINVKMVAAEIGLDEVVVTALGVNKQPRQLGYATSTIKPADVIATNTVNPINALQGKVAGVNINIVGTSGVTSSSSITIRGAKSIDKNNSPIFVIDGIVMENNITDTYGGKDWGSQLKNLNPDDYASITVLKGAAATALYGSRGANGAIVIVSKGGVSRKGVGVEISQTFKQENIYASHIKLQNEYGAGTAWNGYDGGLLADGTLSKTTNSMGLKMEGQLLDQYYRSGEKTPYSPHPNNWKDLYQDGNYSNTNVAINGGNDKAVYRLSYSFMDDKGVLKNNEFNRNSVSFKTNGQINKIFSAEFGLNYVKSKARNAFDQGFYREGQNLGLMTVYYMPRSLDLKDLYNNYRDPVSNAQKTQAVYGTIASFLHRLDYMDETRDEETMLTNLTLKAQIAPWMDASAKANYNMYNTFNRRTEYGSGPYLSGGGYFGTNGTRRGSYNFLFMLHANKKLMNDDLDIDFRIANEIYGNTRYESWAKGTNGGLIVPGLFASSNSVNTIIPSYSYVPRNSEVIGLSGILNFSWKNQLFLELTARNDWNSSLLYPTWIGGENNYSIFYPSANLSWVATDTFRDQLPEWFSFGKLRASLARVGMGTAVYGTSSGAGGFSQGTTYDQDKNSVVIASPNIGTIPNTNLKPEIQQSLELGTDVRFVEDRFGLDFTFYKTNTFNQIMTLGNVTESGATTRKINAGNIQNKGFEIQLDMDPIRTKKLRWNVMANFTVNHSKIIKLHDEIKEWQIMGVADAGPEIWAREGGEFGVITSAYNNTAASAPALFNNPADANDPRNGKRILNYDGTAGSPNATQFYIYATEASVGIKDRKILGKIEPDFLAGLNTSLYYKGFDLYCQVDTRVGGNFFSHSYKYGMGRAALEESLNGRDQAHGGLGRLNYKGETVYDGLMLDAVFADGEMAPSKTDPSKMVNVGGKTYKEVVESGLINPVQANAFYGDSYGWGANVQDPIMENTWVALREITFGYKFPEKILSKIGMQYARLAFSARNIGYLYNGLKNGLNPESVQSNNPLTPYEYGGVPYSRNYSVTLNVKF
jgi:iron complex outermembrane receptor protein